MAKKIDFLNGIGRRKSSIVRIRLYHGKGENIVNGMSAEKYFEGAVALKTLTRPFGITETSDKFYFTAKVSGGGKEGQPRRFGGGQRRGAGPAGVPG